NAEHGQKRAQLVRPQDAQHLPDGVNGHSHCWCVIRLGSCLGSMDLDGLGGKTSFVGTSLTDSPMMGTRDSNRKGRKERKVVNRLFSARLSGQFSRSTFALDSLILSAVSDGSGAGWNQAAGN